MTESKDKTDNSGSKSIPHVFTAISEVQAALAEVGIGKNRRNKDQGFDFRGIDDVYNTLSPLMAKKRLSIIPRVEKRERTQYTTGRGTVMFNVCVEVAYEITSAIDGSSTYARSVGEASDIGDKATNKAMTAAYKYMAFQLFCIPVDAIDADESTPEPVVDPAYKGGQPRSTSQPRSDSPRGQAAGKQQTPAAKAEPKKAEPKKSERTTPYTESELEEIENDISVAAANSNDRELHRIAGVLGVDRAWIEPARLKAMVVKCLASRVNIVTAKSLAGFESLANSFTKEGVAIITPSEARSFCNNARSILNQPLITDSK